MWLFTKVGFFSVTQSPIETDKLQIRARVKTDLQHLMESAGISERIIETPEADYLYRIVIDRELAERLFVQQFRQITYQNFKKMMHDAPGQENKGGALMRVWSAMASLQPTPPNFLPNFMPHDDQVEEFPIPQEVKAEFTLALDNPHATPKASKRNKARKAGIQKGKTDANS